MRRYSASKIAITKTIKEMTPWYTPAKTIASPKRSCKTQSITNLEANKTNHVVKICNIFLSSRSFDFIYFEMRCSREIVCFKQYLQCDSNKKRNTKRGDGHVVPILCKEVQYGQVNQCPGQVS